MNQTMIAERAADLLLQSRKEGRVLTDLPTELTPSSIEEAYAVQDATLRLIGPAGGWKIGPKPDSEPRCSILPATVFHKSGSIHEVPPQGFDVEIETAFVFAHDLPDRGRSYSETEINEAIGSVHLAIELCASRFADRKKLPPLTPIADMQGNAGVILGPPVTDWRDLELADLSLMLSIDGEIADLPHRKVGREATLPILTWLANHAVSRGGGLCAGHAVINGARLGPVPIGPATEIITVSPELGEVRAKFRHTEAKEG